MSFRTYFTFSTGFKGPLHCPKGTLDSIMAHVREVESTLDLKYVPPGGGNLRAYGPNCGGHWDDRRRDYIGVPDAILCEMVEKHNDWVRELYGHTAAWSKAKATSETETITPEQAAKFWHGLTTLDVPVQRWTSDYYRARMESLYEVMRGRESEGMSFGTKALTPAQAGAVIRIFEQYIIDPGDLQLDVPEGYDYLASSGNGEYEWCETHGAIAEQDLPGHSRKRCSLGKQLREEYRL